MRKGVIFLAVMLLVFSNLSSAEAGLTDMGGGLIYDSDLNIIWLQDANYAMTSGYDADGKMVWDDAKTWAENLSYTVGNVTYTDWRLPTTDTSCSGSNCTGSEMGHLFYIEGVTSSSSGVFTNVQAYTYWSGTEFDSTNAWRFSFSSGDQAILGKNYSRYAWAVHDYTPTVVPEPVSSTLFLAGGATLVFRRWIKRKI